MVVTSDGHYSKLHADLLWRLAILYTVPGEWCIKWASDRFPEGPISVNKKVLAFDGDGGFLALLREPTCLVGVGNPLRRDDGVGSWIIGAVRDAVSGTDLRVVDAQDVPENFVPAIARGDCRNVVFIDAVAAEGVPGTVVFGPLAHFAEEEGFSTHKLALSMSRRYLEAAGKKVFLLGIVPASLDFGEGLTAEIQRTAAALRDVILRAAAPQRD